MSAPSDAQIGFAIETTPGTPVTPTTFLPLYEPDISYTRERLESEGVVAGLDVIGSEQWNGGPETVDGSIGTELYANSMGVLFRMMFGSVATTGTAPGPYTHTFTPASGELPSATVQVGYPRVGSAGVDPVTYSGIKVVDWELAVSAGEIATLGLSVVGMDADFDGTPALATASYAAGSGKPLKFNHATLSIGGSQVEVTECTISGDNALNVDRRYLGTTKAAEALREGRRSYTMSLGSEHRGMTHMNRLLNGDEVAVVLNFTAGADQVEISGNARYDSVGMSTDGKSLTDSPMELKFVRSGPTLASAIQAKIIDATATY